MSINTFKGLKTEINENKRKNKNFDKFQYNKLEYLNEVYDNLSTMEVYWGAFQRFIHFQEVNKNKDLYLFNDYEIEELLISIPTTSKRTKRIAWTAIAQYLAWAVEKEYRFDLDNPCNYININEMLKVNRRALSSKIYSLDKIYRFAAEAEIKGNTYQEIVTMLLARYGVIGKENSWLINLKNKDIDLDNNIINIFENNKLISKLTFDDRLKSWIEKAKNETGFEVNGKNNSIRVINYYYFGYVLKSTKPSSKTIKKMAIYGYMNRICNNLNIKKISLSNLLMSRQFDLLDEIREIKGRLTVEDFKNIYEQFNPNSSYSTYSRLLNDYVTIKNIKVSKK